MTFKKGGSVPLIVHKIMQLQWSSLPGNWHNAAILLFLHLKFDQKITLHL